MRDNPALMGKPIAVGGLPTRRGVVATCGPIHDRVIEVVRQIRAES